MHAICVIFSEHMNWLIVSCCTSAYAIVVDSIEYNSITIVIVRQATMSGRSKRTTQRLMDKTD